MKEFDGTPGPIIPFDTITASESKVETAALLLAQLLSANRIARLAGHPSETRRSTVEKVANGSGENVSIELKPEQYTHSQSHHTTTAHALLTLPFNVFRCDSMKEAMAFGGLSLVNEMPSESVILEKLESLATRYPIDRQHALKHVETSRGIEAWGAKDKDHANEERREREKRDATKKLKAEQAATEAKNVIQSTRSSPKRT